nr:competence type IV pilus minor pilin ComGD [Staphylococcus canis]
MLHHKMAFTLVEMLIVMSIISLMTFLMLSHPPKLLSENQIKLQSKLFTTKIDLYQAQAIKHKSPVLLVFRKKQNDIKVVMHNPRETLFIPLTPLKLSPESNLEYLSIDEYGNVNNFGTLQLQLNNRKFKVIFHIEQGRYRIVYLK